MDLKKEIKELFNSKKWQPKTDDEYKFYFVGVFTVMYLLLFIGVPLGLIINIWIETIEFSTAWFLGFLSVILFVLFIYSISRKLISLAYNLAYMTVERGENK